MRNSIKIPLYILLAFVLVFLIAISLVPLIFDPNDYKLEIADTVRKLTGRRLEIEGDLRLQILPKLAVLTGKISMNNPDGFDRETFAEFESGFFRIDLIPLFSKRIEIKKIVLDGLKVHLIRARDGRANWKKFRGSSAPKSGKHRIPIRYQNQKPAQTVVVESPLALLMATKIDILNAEVDYEDRISGIKIDVKDLDFIIDRFDFDRGIDFRIHGNLTSSKPPFHENAKISGRIFVNENLDRFKVEEFRWNSRIDGDILPEEFRQAELTATAEINLAAHTFSATNLRLIAGQTSIGANLSASRIFANPDLDGQISIDQANPARLLKLANLEYAPKDPSALKALNGNFAVALNESRLIINDIALVLDGNPIKGVASIAGFGSPKIKFNFSAQHLDADRYLPDSGTPLLPVKTGTPADDSLVNPGRPALGTNNQSREVGNSTVQGIVNLGSLRYRGLLAEGVQMAFNISNAVVRANQRFQKFYGGRSKGSVEFNNHDHEPVVSLNQTLTDVQIGPLLQDLQGNKPVEGTLETTIRLVGYGVQLQDFKSTLNGDIKATLTNGRFHGVDLDKVIRDSKNPIAATGVESSATGGITKFSKLSYQATINLGIVNGTMLEGTSANFDFSGTGRIDLGNDAVDYRIDAVVNDNPEGIDGIKIKELQGVKIPIQVGGTLSDP
ncbi:MAG: AsmA family protein, partial [Methylococcaceae bacterium]|nr:AsmA family protein [Methylococcaceae bacterium]